MENLFSPQDMRLIETAFEGSSAAYRSLLRSVPDYRTIQYARDFHDRTYDVYNELPPEKQARMTGAEFMLRAIMKRIIKNKGVVDFSETLSRLGIRNMVPKSLGAFPKLNPEYVVRANPDLIMVGDRNFSGLQGRPGWQHIRAIREGRVCVFTADQTDVLVRAGPRLAEGARLMLQCVQDKAR